MTLHDLFGRHLPDADSNHWEGGYFVSACAQCRRRMVRLPGLPWKCAELSR